MIFNKFQLPYTKLVSSHEAFICFNNCPLPSYSYVSLIIKLLS
ncbi:MAG: hypothetical protein Q8S84_03850 [bacterium]|nr:hypothetical protein [bacterium]